MTEHSQSTVCTDVRQQGGSRPADLCARDIPSCDGMFYSWKHTLGNKTYSQVHNTLNNEMHNAIIFKNSKLFLSHFIAISAISINHLRNLKLCNRVSYGT